MTSTEQKMKRLPFDLPESLHRAIKLCVVAAGVTIVDMLRKLLGKHYGGGGPWSPYRPLRMPVEE